MAKHCQSMSMVITVHGIHLQDQNSKDPTVIQEADTLCRRSQAGRTISLASECNTTGDHRLLFAAIVATMETALKR